MSKLRDLEVEFARLVPKLIDKVFQAGYETARCEWLRSPIAAQANAAQGKGIINSLHTIGLAIDVPLYKDGVYLENSKDYQWLGDWWKNQHPQARWGGDFVRKSDGDHFSFEFNGVK